MRAGKENGLLLPSVNGTSGQVLTSQGNGNVVWTTPTSGGVTLDTTQTITGQKTFSATQTNFGSTGSNTTINAIGGDLVLQQTSAEFGTTRLRLTNSNGQNGPIFEQAGSVDVVDFGFLSPSGQGNIRYERRVSSFLAGNSTFEFQIGTPANGELVVGNNNVTVRSGINLRVDTNDVYHQGNIPGNIGEVIHKSSTGISAAANIEVDNGFLRLPVGLPTTAAAGGVVMGARTIGNKILPAFVGPSGLDSALQPFIARNKIGLFIPPGNATTAQTLGMNVTGTGTATAANVATTNIHTAMRRLEYAVTTAATTAVVGLRSGVLQYWIGGSGSQLGGFHFVSRFGPSRGSASNVTRRFFAGFTSNTGAPTDVNVSTTAAWANLIGVGCDSTDANWQVMHRNGTAATTKIDTGIPKSYTDATEMFDIAIFAPPNGGGPVGILFTRLSDGATFSTNITTNLPAATQLLNWQLFSSVGGTSSVMGISVASVYIETDF